ncbi:MAG: Fe2+-dependent dioxygenase [Hyphomonadaceae bacterium]
MFLEIRDILTPAEVARLMEISKALKFVDGRVSNPHATAKNNLQADHGDPLYAESSRIVAEGFKRSREFQDFALPQRVAAPLLARYEPGMKYGVHADAAFMPMADGPLRSDLSCTVFLAHPSTYEGGELTIHIGRALHFKCLPGHAIVYPSTTLHEVQPVRAGQRLVSITFIQSHVADEQKRDALFELGEVSALEGANMDPLNRTRLEAVRQNLMRMWSEN